MTGDPLRIVLLGGTGLVGGALLRRLAAEPPGSVAVRALVRRPGALAGPAWLEEVPGDLNEPLLAGLFWPDAPQVIVHYAVKQIDPDGTGFERVNVGGTERLLAALPASVRGLIYGSTLSVYGSGASGARRRGRWRSGPTPRSGRRAPRRRRRSWRRWPPGTRARSASGRGS